MVDFYDETKLANPRYQEILKLDKMLTEAGIPHTLDRFFDGWRVCYPVRMNRVCDAIEHHCNYGREADLLEMMGLLTHEEEERDRVVGHLTEEDVFGRIKKHWEEKQHG